MLFKNGTKREISANKAIIDAYMRREDVDERAVRRAIRKQIIYALNK